MAEGRTVSRYHRIYQNGYDLSGEVSAFGDLDWDYPVEDVAAFNWSVRGGMCDTPTIRTGTVNTILRTADVGETNPHALIAGWNGQSVNLLIALGIRAAPAMGDPAWCVVQEQRRAVLTPPGSGLITGSIEYAPSHDDTAGSAINYDIPWGVILHPLGAETAASTATGHDGGAATSKGGWMMVQVTACAGTGTATFKVQHASTNSNANFSDVAGLSAIISDTAIPGGFVAQAATTATINRYTRFQVALSGITSVSFILAFVRGR
jgi:hypothetical protein